MAKVESRRSDRLSTYRTTHDFAHYGEFSSIEEFIELRDWGRARGLPIYILGHGSNTLFVRKRIESLVLRNRLPGTLEEVSPGVVLASSSTAVMQVLKYCERRGLDSFYFLASVPAAIGGALAMNAGAGAGLTIYDFVESVTFLGNDGLYTLKADQIERSHRRTQCAGIQDTLIVSANFLFPKKEMTESEIKKRAYWARDHQDLAAPNCGSVFREYHRPILRSFRGFPPFGIRLPFFSAQFSRKVNNWIINEGSSSLPIVALIRLVQAAHRVAGKKAETEVVQVR